MLKIYHNPRCRKSREALALLESRASEFETILYLQSPPTPHELKGILNRLELKAHEIVRTQEGLWKDQFKGKDWSEAELIDLMCEHPKLIERPLVFSDTQGVVGRPLENLENFLNQI